MASTFISNKIFHKNSYQSDHWALRPHYLSDRKVIGIVYFQQSDYVIFLNPEDKRGYRSIVRLINNDRMISTLNREYNSSERIGLALVMAMMTEVYSQVVPISQNIVAANNAHSFDPQTGVVQLGSDEEPLFLHGHVFGRGNPNESYIENVPLHGPVPGHIFDLRAKSSKEPGNETKINWEIDEIDKVVQRLKHEIEHLKENYRPHGLTIVTKNCSFDIYMIRHGETDWNIQRKFQGYTDKQLNLQGQSQAEEVRQRFLNIDYTKIISSDLIRARSTAEIVVGKEKSQMIETSKLLRERCFGKWEGRSLDEFRDHFEKIVDLDSLQQDDYLSFKFDENSESYADVFQRIKSFLRSIIISSSTTDGPMLCFTHGGVIKAILYTLMFKSDFRWNVPNCSFIKLKVQSDGSINVYDLDRITLLNVKDFPFSF